LGTIESITNALSHLSRKRPIYVFFVVLLLITLSIWSIYRAEFGSDITRLIPSDAKRTSLYFELLKDFGGMEKLYIVVRGDIDLHLEDIDKIGNELISTGLFKGVEWKISNELKEFTKESLLKKMPLYLPKTELEEFLYKLSQNGIEEELTRTRARLGLPGGGIALKDPLNIFAPLSGIIRAPGVDFDIESGYFISKDRKLLIMTATPIVSPRDISGTERMLRAVQKIVNTHKDRLSIEITGSHAITHYEASVMKKEIILNILGSFIGVTIIFFIAFKGLRGFGFSIAPVFISIIITTGIMSALWHTITEVSGAFGAMLIGLGIDLGIVLYVRYMISPKDSPESALKDAIMGTGRGITFGVLTTAATFLPMGFSSFKGIREVGLLTGVGILITWIFVFVLSPMILKGKSKRVMPEFKGIRWLFGFSYRRPLVILICVVLIVGGISIFIPKIQVEGDITRLGAKRNPAREAFEELSEKYLRHHNIFLIGSARTPDEASEISYKVKDSLKDSFGLSDLLPPISMQRQNIEAISKIDINRFERDFKKISIKLGFEPNIFDAYVGAIKDMLRNKDVILYKEIKEDIIKNVLKKDGSSYRFLITGSTDSTIDEETLRRLGIEATGPALVREELLGLLWKDSIKLTLIGFLLVNILLFLAFRNIWLVVLSEMPVFLSFLVVLGFMGALGITINFMNVIVFVMLFGIGTDYSIHLIHRYKRGEDIGLMASDTGSAVLLAGLTTFVGFGSMGFSSYRGLSSLGVVTSLGVLTCVILTITILPTFFRLYEKTNNRE